MAKRKHPEPKVGDRHGVMVVSRIVGRGFGRRSEIRVICRCTECGYESSMYEHNMYHHGFGQRCTHKPGSRRNLQVAERRPHAMYETIETFTREERRILFDRILDNFCCDTDTLDGRPCGAFADEECRHNPNAAKVGS